MICGERFRVSCSPYLYFYIMITRLDTVDSTNTYLKALVRNGAGHGTAVVADRQTGGRGRQGKTFFSPAGSGVYLSVFLAPETDKLTLLTTAAAVAVRRAIKNVTGIDTGIKWINDIYKDGKKLCGILAEAINGGAVIGVGLNLFAPTEPIPEELDGKITYLFDGFCDGIKDVLSDAIITELCDICRELRSPAMLDEYRSASIVLGREIEYYMNNIGFAARAVDIDSDGGLITVDAEGKTVTLNAGNISIKI